MVLSHLLLTISHVHAWVTFKTSRFKLSSILTACNGTNIDHKAVPLYATGAFGMSPYNFNGVLC